MTQNTDYAQRLASRVQAYRAKWPERYSEHERLVIAEMAVPLRYQRDGLPEFMRAVVAELVTQRIVDEMAVKAGWPRNAREYELRT